MTLYAFLFNILNSCLLIYWIVWKQIFSSIPCQKKKKKKQTRKTKQNKSHLSATARKPVTAVQTICLRHLYLNIWFRRSLAVAPEDSSGILDTKISNLLWPMMAFPLCSSSLQWEYVLLPVFERSKRSITGQACPSISTTSLLLLLLSPQGKTRSVSICW